jgi:hypothetical protein
MQVEHLSTILIFYAVYFYSKSAYKYSLISSVLLAFITGLKGISISYTIMTILFCNYYFKKKDYFFLFTNIFFSVIILWIIKDELFYAKSMQNLTYDFTYLILSLKKLILFNTYKSILKDIPILIGIFFPFFIVFYKSKRLILNNKFYFIFLFLITLSFVILQKGFTYHYYIYFLFFTFFYISIFKKEIDYKYLAIPSFFALFFYFIFYSSFFFKNSKYDLRSENKNLFQAELTVMNDISRIVKNEKYLLYLTDGVANFYLSQLSYCREFFPIAINRFKHNSSNKFYIKTKECIDSYQGSFIMLQINWFPVDNFWHLLKDYDR